MAFCDFDSDLNVGSFRNVQFLVSSSDTDFGHRGTVHVYPYRPIPFFEDMGRKPREFKIYAYLISQSYKNYNPAAINNLIQADILISAIEADNRGILIHPTRGRGEVICTSARITDGDSHLGETKIEFEFIEAGLFSYPTSGIVLQGPTTDEYLQRIKDALYRYTIDQTINDETRQQAQDAADLADVPPSLRTMDNIFRAKLATDYFTDLVHNGTYNDVTTAINSRSNMTPSMLNLLTNAALDKVNINDFSSYQRAIAHKQYFVSALDNAINVEQNGERRIELHQTQIRVNEVFDPFITKVPVFDEYNFGTVLPVAIQAQTLNQSIQHIIDSNSVIDPMFSPTTITYLSSQTKRN